MTQNLSLGPLSGHPQPGRPPIRPQSTRCPAPPPSPPGLGIHLCSGEKALRWLSPWRATKQCSLPGRNMPRQSRAEANSVCVPHSIPGAGPQQVPAKCLLIRSINSQACVLPAPAGPAGPVHVLTYVCMFLCVWVCKCVHVLTCEHGCACVVCEALPSQASSSVHGH